MVYYLEIVAIGTTLSGTHWHAGGSDRFADWDCWRQSGREALDPCGLTDLLEQTKCQSLLALAERARMVARKYSSLSHASYERRSQFNTLAEKEHQGRSISLAPS
jgi:hypothetical protein